MKDGREKPFVILVSEHCARWIPPMERFLVTSRHSADLIRVSEDELLKSLEAYSPDAVILPEKQLETAAEIAAHGYVAVQILIDHGADVHLLDACIRAGVLTGEEKELNLSVVQLLSEASRLRLLHRKTSTLQRKLDDARLVSRAKMLLMTHLQMSEEEAHRYIEKTSMDSGEARRNIAARIIHTYEE